MFQPLLTRPVLVALTVAAGATVCRAVDPENLLVFRWANLLLKPQLRASATYTDNLFSGNDDVLGPDKKIFRPRVDDLVWQVSPGLRIQYGQMTGNFLVFDFFHDELMYMDHDYANGGQNELDFRSNLQRGKFTLSGTDGIHFLNSYQGGVQSAGLKPLERTEVVMDHRLTFDVSEKTDVYGLFDYDSYDFAKELALYDQDTWMMSLGSTFKPSRKFGFFAEGKYGQTTVTPNSNLPPGPRQDIYGGFLGVRGDFTPKLSGTAKFGYEVREFASGGPIENGKSSAFAKSAPAVSASLVYAYGPKTGFNLTYIHLTGASFQLAAQGYEHDQLNMSVSQALGSGGVWAVSAGGGASLGRFDEVRAIDQSGMVTSIYPKRTDLFFSPGARLHFKPRSWLTATLSYEFDYFDSDGVVIQGSNSAGVPHVYLIDYNNHRFTLQVAIGY